MVQNKISEMRAFLYSSVIVVFLMSCGGSQNIEVPVDSDVPEGVELTSYEDGSGLEKVIKKAGDITVLEGEMLDGVKHGAWVAYDHTGVPTSITTYHKGKKQGVSMSFDSQGYVSIKQNYHNGVLHGESKVYTRKRVTEVKNYVNGQLEGVVTKYYTSGKIMQEAPFKEGKMHGIAKWYDEEGNLSLAYEYEEGELVDKEPEVD